MPFGLCNAPATFQRVINEIFRGLPPECIKSYIDDILIATHTLEEHIQILREVLRRLDKWGLSLHPIKCHFLMVFVKYLGFILSANGIHPDLEKVQAVSEFPVPKTKTNLKSFLGLASYYRRFILGFAKIAKPLTDALHGESNFLTWTLECQTAFELLKRTMTEAPVLAYPDLEKPFFIETDGSKLSIGAILAQKDSNDQLRPVAYGSRTLRGAEVRYGSSDLEMLGVVYALQQFKVYVYGAKITLLTDHKALVDMLQKTHELASDRQERWKQLIRNFDVTVIYRRGTENRAADALSRNPVLRVLKVPARPQVVPPEIETGWLAMIRVKQRQDSHLKEIIQFKDKGVVPLDPQRARWLSVMDARLHLVKGILFYVDSSKDQRLRVVVPESERDHLLWELHYSPLGGHLGMDKTLEKVQ
ncbi:MAG: hypothetical protein GY696_25055, partial [Gammaproteobacteria bacterium]|nr:hypothetical protein [Gammaproteobacteria bacterium]